MSLRVSPPAAPRGSEASPAVHRGSTGPALRPERGAGQFPEQDRAQVSHMFVCIRALPRGCGHPNLGTPRSSLGNHSARWRVQAREHLGQRNPDSLVPRVSSKCSWTAGTSVWSTDSCLWSPPPSPAWAQTEGAPCTPPSSLGSLTLPSVAWALRGQTALPRLAGPRGDPRVHWAFLPSLGTLAPVSPALDLLSWRSGPQVWELMPPEGVCHCVG